MTGEMGTSGDSPAGQHHARAIAVGTLALTVGFVVMMGFTMHQALREMKAKSDLYQEYKDLAKGKKQLELIPESLTRLLVQATTTS